MVKQAIRIPEIQDNDYSFGEVMNGLCSVKLNKEKYTL